MIIVTLGEIGDGRTEMRMEQRGGMTDAEHRRAGRRLGRVFDRMEERLAVG